MVKIINPSAELVWITPGAEQVIARIARTCYKSEDKNTWEGNLSLLQRLLSQQHLAMFDHASASIRFITDRGVSHELVRHRIAGYAQESTRYCNYSKDKFGSEITVIQPIDLQYGTSEYWDWYLLCESAENRYMAMLERKVPPQVARSVLPNCLKTEIVMTTDFTEWMHVLNTRCSLRAHPDMRYIMKMAYEILHKVCPNIFNEKTINNGEREN